MTKDEYEAKRKSGLDAGFTPIATAINDMLIKDEYIASLESENSRLTKAVEKAIIHIWNVDDDCPRDIYPEFQNNCCVGYQRDIKECWRQYLMGDK